MLVSLLHCARQLPSVKLAISKCMSLKKQNTHGIPDNIISIAFWNVLGAVRVPKSILV